MRTEQIHAFDLVTKTLNDGRNINCDLIEALSGWRSAKIALAEHRGEKIPVTVKYAEEDDDQAEELGPLPQPSAPPFIWEGANVLFMTINDFAPCALNMYSMPTDRRSWSVWFVASWVTYSEMQQRAWLRG